MSNEGGTRTAVSREYFGALSDGTVVERLTLRDGVVEVGLVTYGARVVSVKAPGRDGVMAEVALGHDRLEPYVGDRESYMGAVIGRFGNRIAEGKFSIGGVEYQVPLNAPPNALHGGTEGFDRKVWRVAVEGDAVVFRLTSPDGDMGFPGTLELAVTYRLRGGVLRMEYEATTDKATAINVTNHAYFNLAGEQAGEVLGHEVMIAAEEFSPVDAGMIPTGELLRVEGTPFDFREPHTVGERIGGADEQLVLGRGYDHNWVFGGKGAMKLAGWVKDPASGRVLTVETTEPGMQFYTGNFLDERIPSRDGAGTFGFRTGFCLETQGYPDSPNHPLFPSTILRPGETLRSVTTYGFSVA